MQLAFPQGFAAAFDKLTSVVALEHDCSEQHLVTYLIAEARLDNKTLLPCRWWQPERVKGSAHTSLRWLQGLSALHQLQLASAVMCWQLCRVVFSPPVQECGHLWLVLEKNPAGTCFLSWDVAVTWMRSESKNVIYFLINDLCFLKVSLSCDNRIVSHSKLLVWGKKLRNQDNSQKLKI